MNWKNATDIGDNKYQIPGDWLKIEYFEALNILFRVENFLRVFVFIILKNQFADKWSELSITSDDAESSTIAAIAKKRLTQDKNYAYLGYVLNSPLLHLTSGELIRIITSESYWKFFKKYFLGSKEIIKNKLDEIGNVRNSLAHFRPIKKGDIDLVKQNSIHTLSEIENTIIDFISCPDIVPTNTDEQWYKELVTIGSAHCHIGFTQSKNEEWVKLDMTFFSDVIKSETSWRGHSLSIPNLKTNKLLLIYPVLSKYAICITEYSRSIHTKDPKTIKPSKDVRFTFSRESLKNNFPLIKEQLEKILLQISQEIELIKEDNLARGKLIETIEIVLKKSTSSEYFYNDGVSLSTQLDNDSPVEFWGMLNNSTEDFITNTEKYPWMPITISEDKQDPPF